MHIGVIGTGYVGLVSGACFAEFGINVTCVDIDEDKIEKLKKGIIPIYEPGLEELVEKNIKSGRLSFTTNLPETVSNSDAVFIAVGTPTNKQDGHADLSYVYDAAREIARNLKGYTLIITKSTVPVGTAREISRVVRQENPSADFDIASNPEFLREGAAVNDFLNPDRVLIGCDTERAREIMQDLYRPLHLNETPIVFTTPETAEITKYAANAFLAMKITFINQIANLCEKTNADVQDVAKAIGMDNRIGSKFLNAGPGYGGSCFPKDTLAFTQIGQRYNAPQTIIEKVIEVNNQRQEEMAERIIKACGGNVKNKRIGVLGVAFKPNTDDVRDAPSLVIIPKLQLGGAEIAAYDPVAMDQAAKNLENVEWCKDPYEVAKGSDALVILTEWNDFRGLNIDKIGKLMSQKIILDLRNIYEPKDVMRAGFHYISIGKPDYNPSSEIKKISIV